MNATHRFKADTKRERERRGWTREALKIFLLANATVLHNRGYGKKRLQDIEAETLELIDNAIDRYGGDCIVTALEHKCKEFSYGVYIEE